MKSHLRAFAKAILMLATHELVTDQMLNPVVVASCYYTEGPFYFSF